MEIAEVMNRMDGNGLTPEQTLNLSNDLTSYVRLRDKVIKPLATAYSAEQVQYILLTLEPPTLQKQVLAEVFEGLSKREKECLYLFTVENVSLSKIGERLGVSKGAAAVYVNRAKEKLKA